VGRLTAVLVAGVQGSAGLRGGLASSEGHRLRVVPGGLAGSQRSGGRKGGRQGQDGGEGELHLDGGGGGGVW
jgi:hypothetical protein